MSRPGLAEFGGGLWHRPRRAFPSFGLYTVSVPAECRWEGMERVLDCNGPRRRSVPAVAAGLALAACLLLSLSGSSEEPAGPPAERYDVAVYGGTSAAVSAAVQVARVGRSVVLVAPGRHLGGLSWGGLGWTDTGNRAVIGGLAREFYHRIWQHYETPEAWKWQSREEYRNRGQGTLAIDGEFRTL